jgi:L-alanine-DL-glutamate epimerase-like enolase superfamily enzyme
MASSRRKFLKTSVFTFLGSSIIADRTLAGEAITPFTINRLGSNARMKLSFRPYELKLRHVFTVSTNSRTVTPGVQVAITYDGITGYGEASMPPYLGESTESVLYFLKQVNLKQFNDPFQLEDILAYVDHIMPDNTAAKASVDIALHDLVGKLLGASWHKIWGLDKDKAPFTTYTIGIDTVEIVRQKTLEVAEQFHILKVKLGRDNDKEMIETIRSVIVYPLLWMLTKDGQTGNMPSI